jgi:hypothetical protein
MLPARALRHDISATLPTISCLPVTGLVRSSGVRTVPNTQKENEKGYALHLEDEV